MKFKLIFLIREDELTCSIYGNNSAVMLGKNTRYIGIRCTHPKPEHRIPDIRLNAPNSRKISQERMEKTWG